MKTKTPKEKTIYRLLDGCRTGSRRPKKVFKGINQFPNYKKIKSDNNE